MLHRIMNVYTWILVAIVIVSYFVKTNLAESIGLFVLILIGFVYQVSKFFRTRRDRVHDDDE